MKMKKKKIFKKKNNENDKKFRQRKIRKNQTI